MTWNDRAILFVSIIYFLIWLADMILLNINIEMISLLQNSEKYIYENFYLLYVILWKIIFTTIVVTLWKYMKINFKSTNNLKMSKSLSSVVNVSIMISLVSSIWFLVDGIMGMYQTFCRDYVKLWLPPCDLLASTTIQRLPVVITKNEQAQTKNCKE